MTHANVTFVVFFFFFFLYQIPTRDAFFKNYYYYFNIGYLLYKGLRYSIYKFF
jgi:hypothetical protein